MGARVVWVWPVASRGVLAVFALVAASLLGVTVQSEQPTSTERVAQLPRLVLDPNTAPEPVLAALPHAGPGLVSRLAAARRDRPFGSAGDAGKRVRGLGSSMLAQLAPHFRFPTADAARAEKSTTAPDRAGAVPKKRVARRASGSRKPVTATSTPPRLALRQSKADIHPTIEIDNHD